MTPAPAAATCQSTLAYLRSNQRLDNCHWNAEDEECWTELGLDQYSAYRDGGTTDAGGRRHFGEKDDALERQGPFPECQRERTVSI